MDKPQTLKSLGRQAKREGLDDLLDTPLDELLDALGDRIDRASPAFEHLGDEHGCETLRDLLDDPSADACLVEYGSASHATRFIAALETWLSRRGGQRAAPAAEVAIPLPPGEMSALRRWAIQHEVLDALEHPATVLQHAIQGALSSLLRGGSGLSPAFDEKGRAGTLRIEDVLALPLPPVAAGKRRATVTSHLADLREHLQALSRVYLFDLARTRAALLAARDALSARAKAPTEAALRALFQRLDRARDELGKGVIRRPLGAYWPAPMLLRTAPLRLAYAEARTVGGREQRASEVEVRLDDDPIRPRCPCPRPPGAVCDHQIAAIDAAIDVLRDPESPLRPALVQALGTPAWERFLNDFDKALATARPKDDPDAGRIIFRVGSRFGDPTIELAVQTVAKRGGWTSGRRVEASDLAFRRDLVRDARDARVIEILAEIGSAYGYGGSARRHAKIARAFGQLVGHPRVFFDARPEVAATIVRAPLRLGFASTPEGVTPLLSLGARRCTPAELLAAAKGSEHLILVDEPSCTVYLSSLDDRAQALIAALDRHPATFPEESHDALLRKLEPLQESLTIELPDELSGQPIEADRRPVIRLSPLEGSPSTEVSIFVRPMAEGPLFAPGEGPEVVLGTVAGKRVAAHRRLAEEPAATMKLLRALPIPVPIEHSHEDESAQTSAQTSASASVPASAWTFTLPGEDALLDLLTGLRSLGDQVIVEWPDRSKMLSLGAVAQRSMLKLAVREKRDWFGVEGELSIEGEAVPFSALLDAVRRGRRYVEVSPRRFALIEEDLKKRLAAAADVLFEGRSGLELALPGAAVVADLVDDIAALESVARFRDLIARIDASRALDPALPPGLRAELRHYQLDGFRWLARLASWGLGGCLADDMGLGKTVQALALLLQRSPLGPALVVAPTSVVSNWADEAARFAPDLRVLVYRGPARAALLGALRPGDLLLTSYGLLTRDAEPLAATPFATLVLDEAQAIKNAFTRRARAVRDLKADFRVALTGTPVENHLGELWSLMRVLAPGLFGSWDQFRARFAVPIERARDPERSQALARTLRPFVLRRTKAEVTPELPERTEIARVIDLSAAERRLYDEARRAALAAISSGEGDARFILLAALTRLRRLACHPRLFDPSSLVPSSKLAALMEIVGELRETGHRALVFSQFTTHLALVREALDRKGISYAYLDGSTPVEQRAARIASFQAGEAELFLISLKAGGTGLNLTAADYVIHLDPWWNPAVEDQATDRAHRIGQTRPVTVIRLISRGTIEESVVALHGEKRALSASLFDEEGGPAQLSVDDLASLIREGVELGSGVGEDEAGDALGEEAVAEEGREPGEGAGVVANASPSPRGPQKGKARARR